MHNYIFRFIAAGVAALAVETASFSEPSQGQRELTCSLVVAGKTLNPWNMRVERKETRCAVVALHANLRDQLGHDRFEFVITGGSRFIDGYDVVSFSDFLPVEGSARRSMHAVDGAIDVVISGPGMTAEIASRARTGTGFAGGYFKAYSGDRYHFGLPRPSDDEFDRLAAYYTERGRQERGGL